MSNPLHRLTSFLGELKRRRVYRVGIVYAAVAFVLLQGVDLVADPLRLPGVVMTVLVVATLFGFPLALVLAWAFEVTPDGVRRTEAIRATARGPDSAGDAESANARRRRGQGGVVALLGVGILVAGTAGWWLLAPGGGGDAVDVAGIRSVAVLPLDNFSGDPSEDPFVAGMHEELINQLSRVGALLVKSRTSVMRYRTDGERSIPEIGRELGVDAILEGSVLRVEDQVRITVQLIHVPTDTHLWSESFVRELRDVLALHGEVARAVADEVRAVLTPEESQRLVRTREVDPRALEHYVRGRYLWNQREEGPLRQALSEFQAALEVDPTYAEAWAGIADTYVVPAGAGLAEDALAQASDAARRALALDSTLAEAHTSLAYGLMGEWAWEESEHHFRRAIELNPSYATAHQWYAELLVATNRVDEAVASARRARVRDPLSPIIAFTLARTLRFARRPHEALEQLHRVPIGHPRDVAIGAFAHLDLGQPDSAWTYLLDQTVFSAEVQDALQRHWEGGMSPLTAMNALLRAFVESSEDSGGPDGDLAPPGGIVTLTRLQAAVAEGHVQEALDLLEDAVTARTIGLMVADLVADPTLDPIRQDPRYRSFLRQVGLAEYWPTG